MGPPLLVVAAIAMSCRGDSETGNLRLDVYDAPVECRPEDGLEEGCRDVYGEIVEPQDLIGFAFMSTEPSEFHPEGLYFYFELDRGDGVMGRGEIDVPLDPESEAEPVIHYMEHRAGELLFAATEVRGVVTVPMDLEGERCDCVDGAFELELVDPGLDEELGTEDDLYRRFSRAVFGWGSRRCMPQRRRAALPETLLVEQSEECPMLPAITEPPTSSGPDVTVGGSGGYYSDDGSGCNDSSDYDHDGSCNGDGGSSSSSGGGCDGDGGSSSGSGGCGGDGGGSSGGCGGDGGSSGGGCEGDSSGGSASCAGDSSAGSGSCSGDTGGSSGSCSGSSGSSCADGASVAAAARVQGPRRRGGRRGLPSGPLQTFAFVVAALWWMRVR